MAHRCAPFAHQQFADLQSGYKHIAVSLPQCAFVVSDTNEHHEILDETLALCGGNGLLRCERFHIAFHEDRHYVIYCFRHEPL